MWPQQSTSVPSIWNPLLWPVTAVGPYPVDPQKVVNQQWVLIVASTKVLSASFFSLIALLPDYNVGILRWTNTSWCCPVTNFLCLIMSLSVHYMSKVWAYKTQILCQGASSIFCSNGWIGPRTHKKKRTSAIRIHCWFNILHGLPTSTSHCLCK